MKIAAPKRTGWGWLLVGLLFSGTAAVGCTALGRFAIPQFAQQFAEAGLPLFKLGTLY